MTPTFWTWATEHWLLTFILALLVLRIIRSALKALLAPLERLVQKPEEETAAVQTTEAEEEDEDEEDSTSEELDVESEKDVEAVVVPVRSRFERL